MRPTRFVLPLAALLSLAPAASLAGEGGGGGGTFPSGLYPFKDRVSDDRIISLAHIDQAFQEFCLAGSAAFTDPETTLNHRVQWDFSSLGSIGRQDSRRVEGVFTNISLTLTVFDSPLPENALFSSTIDASALCDLDGSLRRDGDEIRARLSCELGPFLSSKGKIPSDILESISRALEKRKSIKIDIKKGGLRINHNGFTPPDYVSPLVCLTSSDVPD